MDKEKPMLMTISINPKEPADILIMSDNLEGSAVFYESQIMFLEKALSILKKKSKKVRKEFDNYDSYSNM